VISTVDLNEIAELVRTAGVPGWEDAVAPDQECLAPARTAPPATWRRGGRPITVREAVDRVVAVCDNTNGWSWRTALPDPLSDSKGRSTREHVTSLPAIHRGDDCSCACTGCLATLHYIFARNYSERPGWGEEAKWNQEFADALFLLHDAQVRQR
jgi:hypothetical protein